MVLQRLNRPGERPEHVYIGGFGGQHGGQSGVGRLAVQPRPADAGSGEKVGKGIHSAIASLIAWIGEQGKVRLPYASLRLRSFLECDRPREARIVQLFAFKDFLNGKNLHSRVV